MATTFARPHQSPIKTARTSNGSNAATPRTEFRKAFHARCPPFPVPTSIVNSVDAHLSFWL